ncbi:hypothetical protein [Cellulomonas sp. KH9]|uniref:hypothetical protein n=1 Tax=Cellulomonas sp. KH9 TaxID=1855324 RepID=UPI0008E4C9BB|nr:hypothetical protein [Cellulomonas sp. KH9]SFJ98530.1 hypothetical protein SAMN05216467_1550 [Cellulomonas sp. KH9]
MSSHSVRTARQNRVVYWVAIGLLAVLVVIALVSFRGARGEAAAADKAEELVLVLQEAGVERLPSTQRVADVLGVDGGAVCDDPAGGLRRSTLHLMLTNGAAGPGMRPVITDSRLLQGQVAIVSVYCPEYLEEVQAQIDELRTADVAGD